MAASATPRPTRADDAASAANPALAALQGLKLALPLAVAYSGGADSTALLHAAAARWPGQVQAIHVHHGLQPAADGFERHCRLACERLALPLHVGRVDARHGPGDSPEDMARKARYQALARTAQTHGLSAVLLAQHADDQVETVLLALSRGAGLPGLAAMPQRFERHGVLFLRPLLELPGPRLRQWLHGEGIDFIEDPMNADPAFTRSRIRALLPAIEQAFPAMRETFARSARHAAHAQALLAELAQQDLAAMGGRPALGPLRDLSRLRQANLLRGWLRACHAASPSAAQLEELLDQVQACSTRGHQIRLKVAHGSVLREGDFLVFVPPPPGLAASSGSVNNS